MLGSSTLLLLAALSILKDVGADFYYDEFYRDMSLYNGSRFGASVSLANEMVAVGAPFDKSGSSSVNGGSVSLFSILGGFERLREIAPPNPTPSSSFGKSLSIGEYNLAVGAMNDTEGIVHMYTYGFEGSTLVVTLVQNISASAVETMDLSNFGNSVSLFDAPEIGTLDTAFAATLAVGAPSNQGSQNRGVVFVYSAPDSLNAQWAFQAMILPPDSSITCFGQTVSLYSNTLAVSAVKELEGVVFIFDRTADMTWKLTAELHPSEGSSGDGFGSSLSLRFELLNSGYEVLSLAVGAPSSEAAYIMIFDPRKLAWSQNAKLLMPEEAKGEFGYSVAIYERYVAVGSRSAPGGGCVTTYQVRNESNRVVWDVMSTSKPTSVTAGAEFGYSLTMAGTYFVVGAPALENSTGAAYLYTLSIPSNAPTAAPTFAPTAVPSLAPTQSPTIPIDFYPDDTYQDLNPVAGSRFGSAVSIANEIIVVGATRDAANASGYNAGSVSVFDAYGSSKSVYELSHPDPSTGGYFGKSVSVGEENLAVAGISNGRGVVYAYHYEFLAGKLTFNLVKTLSPTEYELPLYGASVSLIDTSVVSIPEASMPAFLAVGAPAEAQDSTNVGAVYIYYADEASMPVWTQQAVLIPSVGTKDFGRSVSLYSNALAVSATNNGGVVFVYNRTSTMEWKLMAQLAPSTTTSSDFGLSLSLRFYLIQDKYDVLGLAVGDPASDAVYVMVYDPRKGAWSQNAMLRAPAAAQGEFGYSVALYERYLAVGSRTAASTGCLTTYQARNDSNRVVWQVLSTSTPDGVEVGSEFGASVAMSGQHVVAGAPGYRDGTGSAYLYSQSSTFAPTRAPTTRDDGESKSSDDWSLKSFDNAAILMTVLLSVGAVTAVAAFVMYRRRRESDLKTHLLSGDMSNDREPRWASKL